MERERERVCVCEREKKREHCRRRIFFIFVCPLPSLHLPPSLPPSLPPECGVLPHAGAGCACLAADRGLWGHQGSGHLDQAHDWEHASLDHCCRASGQREVGDSTLGEGYIRLVASCSPLPFPPLPSPPLPSPPAMRQHVRSTSRLWTS